MRKHANATLHTTVFSLALLCGLATSAPAWAQTALMQPAFPLTVDGSIDAEARAPDGSVVIGGLFTTVDGVARNGIARITADGHLDAGWNPDAEVSNSPTAVVYAVAVDASGAVYVGGAFDHIGGAARQNIAKCRAPEVAPPTRTGTPAQTSPCTR